MICARLTSELTLMGERVQVKVFPAFESLSTFWARERVAGVEQSVQTNKNTEINRSACQRKMI